MQKKVAVYSQYLERMQVVRDYAEQVRALCLSGLFCHRSKDCVLNRMQNSVAA